MPEIKAKSKDDSVIFICDPQLERKEDFDIIRGQSYYEAANNEENIIFKKHFYAVMLHGKPTHAGPGGNVQDGALWNPAALKYHVLPYYARNGRGRATVLICCSTGQSFAQRFSSMMNLPILDTPDVIETGIKGEFTAVNGSPWYIYAPTARFQVNGVCFLNKLAAVNTLRKHFPKL